MGTLLEAWHHVSEGSRAALILPDGCQDLIGTQRPGEAPRWFLAPLADRAYLAPAVPGQRYRGYRLRPGVQVNALRLFARMDGCELEDQDAAHTALAEATVLDSGAADALQAIAESPTLAQARAQLGMGERSLQRLLAGTSGRPPQYWRRLARWRLVLRLLETDAPLADVAAMAGYADQAHMNLECRRWAGLSPRQLRQRPDLLRLGHVSGHG